MARNRIEFRITAKDEASQKLRNVSDSVETINRSILRLAGTVAGALSVNKIAEYANQWRLLENRIKLVTKSSAELVTIQDELIKLSLRSRTPFEATANLYARVARSSRELGLSQQELLDFTETVSKSIRVSGSTAAEASAGVIQFGQALASSRLSGDELRSVLEQMPRLAQAIADGMGVGIGRLRELGEAGELTSDKVLDALRKSAPAIREEFALLAPLVSEAVGNMDTALISFIGRMDEALGISVFFAEGIIDLSDELTLFDDALLGTLEPADNLSESMGRLSVFIIATTIAIQSLVKSLTTGLGFAFDQSVGLATVASKIFEGVTTKDFAPVGVAWSNFLDEFSDEGAETFTELGEDLWIDLIDGMEKAFQAMGKGRFEKNLLDLTTATGAADPVTRKQREAIAKAVQGLEKMLSATQDSNAAMRLAEIIAVDYAEALSIVKANALGAASGNDELLLSVLQSLELQRELKQAAEERAQAEKDAAQALADSLKFMQSLADQAARNIQDAFADFLFDPFEDGIKGMLKSFIDALRQMLAQALAFQVLSSLPGDIGKFFTTRASGGPVNAGQPVLVGERGPELFIPGASGTIANNTASKASGGGTTFVTNIDARGADPGLIARLPGIMDQRDRQLMLKMKTFIETGSVTI